MIEYVKNGGGLYIHIPFCAKKCLYCDFYTGGASLLTRGFIDKFTTKVVNEIKSRIHEFPSLISTIYMGGGTPSLLPPDVFTRFVHEIRGVLERRMDIREFTVEANPEDVDMQHIEAWKSAGVTRVSLGVQSLSQSRLRSVGRGHSVEQAHKAMALLTQNFDNVSVDVMFGFPMQKGDTVESEMESLANTLHEVLSYHPQHISAYSLMYESSTALTLLRDQGRITELPEGVSLEMFALIDRVLTDHGYERYEISNFALPGFRSIHNSSYWDGVPYIGVGPSAHSFDGGRIRRANRNDIRAYVAFDFDNDTQDKFYIQEELSDEELREEYIMLSLRKREGIDLEEYRLRFGESELKELLHKAAPLIRQGHLINSDHHLHLSSDAIMLSDSVIVDLI